MVYPPSMWCRTLLLLLPPRELDRRSKSDRIRAWIGVATRSGEGSQKSRLSCATYLYDFHVGLVCANTLDVYLC